MDHPVVSRAQWLAARKQHLQREKELTRLRDELAAERRALPWVRVDKDYRFIGPNGSESLADLFGDRHQLIVYHFMFNPAWQAGCKSCSFWMDQFDGASAHLRQRNAALVLVSRAPLATLEAFRDRMGWRFKWVSSGDSDFNYDYGVAFTAAQLASGSVDYNYGPRSFPGQDAPGLSVFVRDEHGAIFHTYSCYARGLDILNGAYQVMDMLPRGRDENDLPYSMSWVRLHDEYT